MPEDSNDASAVELATDLTIAWLSNPNTRAAADDVAAFLAKMHEAASNLGQPSTSKALATADAEYTPATTVRRSLSSPDYIISLIDGKKLQDAASSLGDAWLDAGAIPRALQAESRLSDGGTELFGSSSLNGQVNRAWTEGPRGTRSRQVNRSCCSNPRSPRPEAESSGARLTGNSA